MQASAVADFGSARSGLGWSHRGFLGDIFSTHSIGLRNIWCPLGTPFALALRISSSVFGAANVREWFEGGWACLMGGASLSDKFWVCDSSDFL